MELPFARVRFGVGYNIKQVDDFFAYSRTAWSNQTKALTEREVRYVQFDLVRKGYRIFEVDEALGYIERELAKRTKQEIIEMVSDDNWAELITSNVKEFYMVLVAPKKKKFEVDKNSQMAYEYKSVDKYLKTIYKQFFEGKKKLTANAVKKVVFPCVKAANGYSTQKVDEFLDKVIEVLNALEA
ncbi:MAG: DivIVA domain-containing protein [Candidatus Ancillula sp.]|jgi:DivIVA domain-containing protein|nr:DivIVA domain-containing protein [Candidatus Ancillula sp.]